MVAKNTVGIVLKHGLTTMPADSYIGIQSDWLFEMFVWKGLIPNPEVYDEIPHTGY